MIQTIKWYDNWFIRYLPENVVNDQTLFPGFRYRYNLYKKEEVQQHQKVNVILISCVQMEGHK